MTRRHEFYVLRRRLRFQLFCEQCAVEEEFVTLDDAVLFSGLAAREIVRLANENELHFLETSGGHLFVCHASLNEKESADFTELEQLKKHQSIKGETK